MNAAWLNSLRSDVETFAKRLTETADLYGKESRNAEYWFLGSEARVSLNRAPADFMVGSIADDLMVLETLQRGAAPDRIHLEAMASILLHLATREELE